MFQVTFHPQYCVSIVHSPDVPVSIDLLFETELCFVWGFLMDPHFIRDLLGHYVPFAPACISGLQRTVSQEQDQWNFQVSPEDRGVIHGIVLIDLSQEDYVKLDQFEQVPLQMDRRKIQCRIGDLERVANIYLPSEDSFE